MSSYKNTRNILLGTRLIQWIGGLIDKYECQHCRKPETTSLMEENNMVSLDFLNRLFLKPTPWKIRWFYPTLPISIGIESATCENSTNQTAQKARHKQETTSKHIVAMLKNIKYRCGSYAFRVIKHVDHIHIIYIYDI